MKKGFLQREKKSLKITDLEKKEAKKSKFPLQIISAYRSFTTQAALKSNYKITYGAGTANQFEDATSTIEHILPENPTSEWETAFPSDEQEEYIYL